ncbi:hypothetical protein BHM03_00052718, partial [Ensete ventricosum]
KKKTITFPFVVACVAASARLWPARPLAREVAACVASAARDCLRVRPPVACEAATCAASAARDCLRVWSPLDAAAFFARPTGHRQRR